MAYDAIIAVAVVLTVVPLTLLLVYAFLSRVTRGPDHVYKRLRYEAGNPPRGAARIPTIYQYFGYILIFVALDPVFMLLFVLPAAAGGQWLKAVLLSMASVAAILPPIVYAARYARRREYWSLP
ncbi:NADH ubiquinone oxidoreductase chain A [Pyrodictium delaneyi]|uniref:NADH ubiquinone oxidoreductase chain A n=1 Tax=Pyrodictium delaneyi TaxID=1273541 RepID=A0A0P0N456_9CREN|nr:NADH-quinone oxidoreductase subunit A [Pyrodictium delaneyi]ALL01515.1 NADH ubiquinone oxidoreductase chain A [Pyrodictium delaneyi]OWJ54581.1 hypothetical protein Pdsh_06005 [Pyrodictium delaneyi]